MTRPTPAMFQLNSPFLNIEDVSIKAFPTKGDPEFWIQILSKQQAWGHQLIRTDTQGLSTSKALGYNTFGAGGFFGDSEKAGKTCGLQPVAWVKLANLDEMSSEVSMW